MKTVKKENGIKFVMDKNGTRAFQYRNAPVTLDGEDFIYDTTFRISDKEIVIYGENKYLTKKLNMEIEVRGVCENNFDTNSTYVVLSSNCSTLIRSVKDMCHEVENLIKEIMKCETKFTYVGVIRNLGSDHFMCEMLCNLKNYAEEEKVFKKWHGTVQKYSIDSMRSFDEIKEYIVGIVKYSDSCEYICSDYVYHNVIVYHGDCDYDRLLSVFERKKNEGYFKTIESKKICLGIARNERIATGEILTHLEPYKIITKNMRDMGYYYYIYSVKIYHMEETDFENIHCFFIPKPLSK